MWESCPVGQDAKRRAASGSRGGLPGMGRKQPGEKHTAGSQPAEQPGNFSHAVDRMGTWHGPHSLNPFHEMTFIEVLA